MTGTRTTRLRNWSAVGLAFAVPFLLLVLKGYWALLRCALGPWLGPCPDPKGAGWLAFFLGLPWTVAAEASVLSGVGVILGPLLNTVLLYNLGRMVQYAWPAIHNHGMPTVSETMDVQWP